MERCYTVLSVFWEESSVNRQLLPNHGPIEWLYLAANLAACLGRSLLPSA